MYTFYVRMGFEVRYQKREKETAEGGSGRRLGHIRHKLL